MRRETPKKMTRREEIAYLVSLIKRSNNAYYNTDEPVLSDAEYDRKKERLAKISPGHAVLNQIGAKVETPAYSRSEDEKMGSLRNIKSLSELNKWLWDMKATQVLITPKVDGLSGELVHNNHEFNGGYTRGDGKSGTDVTQVAIKVPSVPTFVESEALWVTRGEFYITYSAFTKMNEELVDQGKVPYKLPRSAAAGILLSGNSTKVKKTGLSFLAWEVHRGDKSTMELKTERARLNAVHELLNVAVVPKKLLTSSDGYVQVREYELERLNDWRKTLDYPTDGLVFSINFIKELKKAGWTETCPKGKAAYKFPPEQKETIVNAIKYQTGRTGKITPVVYFNGVTLGGSFVEKASMFNFNRLKEMDCGYGSTVLVEKACEIIPQIVKTVKKGGFIVKPHACPVCKGELTEDGENLFCLNQSCGARLPLRIKHWFKTLDVLGAGIKATETMSLTGLDAIHELYYRPVAWFRRTMGKKNGEKFFEAMHYCKRVPLAKFLEALGYEEIGTTTARKLAEHLHGIEDLKQTLGNTVESVFLMVCAAGIRGNAMPKAVAKVLFNNAAEIEELSKVITVFKEKKTTGKLEGKIFCITGTLSMTRSEFAKKITANGGTFSPTVKAHGDSYLIAGENGGSKITDARNLAVPIITEKDFNTLIEDD